MGKEGSDVEMGPVTPFPHQAPLFPPPTANLHIIIILCNIYEYMSNLKILLGKKQEKERLCVGTIGGWLDSECSFVGLELWQTELFHVRLDLLSLCSFSSLTAAE